MAPKRSNRRIIQRVDESLKKRGISARRASIDAGFSPDLIRDWRRDPQIMPTIDALEALAPVLEEHAAYLAFGVTGSGQEAQLPTIDIIGEVAAGLWLDVDGPADQEGREATKYVADPDYPAEAQYGLRVKGTSINRFAKPNAILHCLDIKQTGIEPSDGEFVIVERRRADGAQKEVTAKKWYRKGRKIELSPDSTDPRWHKPIVFDSDLPPGEEVIELVAVVLRAYQARAARRPAQRERAR